MAAMAKARFPRLTRFAVLAGRSAWGSHLIARLPLKRRACKRNL